MRYGGTTNYLDLPYMVQGDYLNGAEEKRRASILDGMLYIATYGMRDAIINDAVYSIEDITDTSCKLVLTGAGTRNVLQAVSGYRFLCIKNTPPPLELSRGFVHWIYLSKEDGFETDPESCSLISRTSELTEGLKLLLAKVDFTGETPVLTTDASINKKFYTNISGHSLETANPHGNVLKQRTLNVQTELTVSGKRVLPCIYARITSAGTTGVTVPPPENFMPVFVTAMPEALDAGQIACIINTDGSITVTNSGGTDIGINLRIEGTFSETSIS